MTALFESFNWGVAPVPEQHDLGTDLWVAPRDALGWDAQALIGVQVKTSRLRAGSFFKEPVFDEGHRLTGWWFRAGQDHFGYWAEHAVPHIVVLHCLEDCSSYWVHVTTSSIQNTGKGAKILVPADQELTGGRVDLLQVAAEGRRQAAWEGSLGAASKNILPEDQLRTALVVPRLIAPHPSSVGEGVLAHEAVAMLVQCRFRELTPNPMLQKEPLTPKEPASEDSWEWRFYSGLQDYLTNDDTETLKQRVDDAPGPVEKAVAVAAYCVALQEEGRVAAAIPALDCALAEEDLRPRDRLWLEVHRAWALLELGRAREARQLAAEVQSTAGLHRGDPTADAFRASLADLMFATASMGEWNAPGVVSANDTVANWWRDATLGRGALERVDADFTSWAKPSKQRDDSYGDAWRHMRSAAVMAAFAANRRSWRRASALSAQEQLLTTADHAVIIDAFHVLRRSGEAEAVTQAGRRLLRHGPAAALRDAALGVELKNATRTSLRADMRLLQTAGDVLPSPAADDTLDWVLAILDDPARFIDGYEPTFRFPHALLELVKQIALALSKQGRERLTSHFRDMPTEDDQLTARTYGEILDALPARLWPQSLVVALRARQGDNFELQNAIDRLVSDRDPDARKTLEIRISQGELNALHAYGDVRDLPTDVAQPLLAHVRDQVKKVVDQAGRGYSMGSYNPLRTLTLLNIHHPAHADWELVVAALAKAAGSPQDLSRTLLLLASLPDDVPAAHRDAVADALRGLTTKVQHLPWMDQDDVSSQAKDALNALVPGSIDLPALFLMLQGATTAQSNAVLVLARQKRPTDVPLLAAIAATGEPPVRAMVGHCLARWVCDGIAVEDSLTILAQLLNNEGTYVARSVTDILNEAPRSEGADLLATALEGHLSADVRSDILRYRTQGPT